MSITTRKTHAKTHWEHNFIYRKYMQKYRHYDIIFPLGTVSYTGHQINSGQR